MAGYLESSRLNREASLEIDDVGVQANAAGYLVDALSFAARIPKALRVAEESLERFPRHLPREAWTIGVSPHSWYSFWRAISLAWMGRVPEGIEEMERCRRMTEEDGTPEMMGYALSFGSEIHFLSGNAEHGLASAMQCEELSRGLGEEHPVMAAHAQRSFAYAHLTAGRPADAVEPAQSALEIFGRTEKQHTGMAATLLAIALLETGDLQRGQLAAEEALSLCRHSMRGNFEALVHGVLARIRLRRDGATAAAGAAESLARAAALIERAGASSLAPMLCEWRAELAGVIGEDEERERLLGEAGRGYRKAGAPIKAERLTRELATRPR